MVLRDFSRRCYFFIFIFIVESYLLQERFGQTQCKDLDPRNRKDILPWIEYDMNMYRYYWKPKHGNTNKKPKYTLKTQADGTLYYPGESTWNTNSYQGK